MESTPMDKPACPPHPTLTHPNPKPRPSLTQNLPKKFILLRHNNMSCKRVDFIPMFIVAVRNAPN